MNYIIDGIDFHEIEPMKYWQAPAAWDAEKSKREAMNRIYGGDWLGSWKHDGAFYKLTKYLDGHCELTGRSRGVKGDFLDKLAWVPQIASFVDTLPLGTCLLGELYFPNNESSKATTTITGCKVEKAIERQTKGDALHYYIFDCLAWDGKSMILCPAKQRFAQVESLELSNPYVEKATYYSGNDLYAQLQDILAGGGEGMVIMHEDAPYEPGKRPSKTTMKLKKQMTETIDCVVIGAQPPTKSYGGKNVTEWMLWWDEVNDRPLPEQVRYLDFRNGATITPVTKAFYYNWCGSLKLGLYKDGELVHFGDVSGLTDEIKRDWRDYVGRVVEVGGMEIFKDTEGHGIRHPKIISWRDDKKPEDCLWSQIE